MQSAESAPLGRNRQSGEGSLADGKLIVSTGSPFLLSDARGVFCHARFHILKQVRLGGSVERIQVHTVTTKNSLRIDCLDSSVLCGPSA